MFERLNNVQYRLKRNDDDYKGRQLLGEKFTARENSSYVYEKMVPALRWYGPPNG